MEINLNDSDSFDNMLSRLSCMQMSSRRLRASISAMDSPIIKKNKRKKTTKTKNVNDEVRTSCYKLQDFTGVHRICFVAKGETDPLWKYALQLFQEDRVQARRIARSQENGMIPLFLACQRQPPADVVRALINVFPASLYYRNKSSSTCLHVACKFNASFEVIRMLVERHPDPIQAIEAVNNNNETPLLLWMYSNDCRPPPLTLFKLLMNPKVMRMDDNQLNNPCQLICNYVHQRDIGLKNIKTRKENTKHLFDAYLDSKPYGSSKLMKEVAQFPSWLQDHVSQHCAIRYILNFRISQKLTTAVLMLDFLARILIITAYSSIMVAYANSQITAFKSWIPVLIISIIYLSFRELLQLLSFPFHSYITDVWNWLDAMQIICLSICTHAFARDGLLIDDTMNVIMTFTSFLVWISMASFLRALYLPFSIMIMGVIHVTKVLAPFLVTLFCLLGSFALMFFTNSVLARGNMGSACALNTSDFCSMREAMYNTYSLFIGIKEFDSFQNDFNQVAIVVFISLSTILLLNVVIAIVNDSFGDVADEAEKLFWLNRIYFVCEIESVRNFLLEDSIIARFFSKSDDETKNEQNYNSARYLEGINDGDAPQDVSIDRVLFDILVSSLTYYDDPDERIKIESLFKQVNHGGFGWIVEAPLFLRQVCSILIFPMWIMLGIFSLGVLWPPQVREYLLCPNICELHMDVDMINKTDTSNLRLCNQQEECLQILREQVQNMTCEIRHIKNEIDTLMKDGEDTRKDLKMMKDVMIRVNMKLNLFS